MLRVSPPGPTLYPQIRADGPYIVGKHEGSNRGYMERLGTSWVWVEV